MPVTHARRLVTTAATVLTTIVVLAAPAPAAEQETTVRPFVVTFNGRGVVEEPDGPGPWTVSVFTYNPAIGEDECSAIVYTGNLLSSVVSCRFFYDGYFQPSLTWPCTGAAVATGHLIVYTAAGTLGYEFPGMRAVIDEGSVHAVATEVIDPTTGERRPGYAQFDFAARCGSRAQNFGRALY